MTSATALRAQITPPVFAGLDMQSKTVQILNPSANGSRYTSRKNADRLVKRGLACYERGESSISFLASEWLQQLNAGQAAKMFDDRLIEQRGGKLWWNGCDTRPNACHRPGENVSYPRPDRAKPYLLAMERMLKKS